MKRTPIKKKRKDNSREIALWASYGLKRPPRPRYSGLQGVLWYVMSQYVRRSEFEVYNGECVDGCGIPVHDWREADCGHFQSSTKSRTRFERKNLGLQRKYCNSPLQGNDMSYGFGKMINKRYGEGTAEELIELGKEKAYKHAKEDLDKQIRHFIALLEKL